MKIISGFQAIMQIDSHQLEQLNRKIKYNNFFSFIVVNTKCFFMSHLTGEINWNTKTISAWVNAQTTVTRDFIVCSFFFLVGRVIQNTSSAGYLSWEFFPKVILYSWNSVKGIACSLRWKSLKVT